jgi:hypothetical protein
VACEEDLAALVGEEGRICGERRFRRRERGSCGASKEFGAYRRE